MTQNDKDQLPRNNPNPNEVRTQATPPIQPGKPAVNCNCAAQPAGDRRPDKFSLDWWLDSPATIFSGLLVIVVFLQFVWMVRQEKWLRLTAEVQAAVERSYVSVDNWALSPPITGEPPRSAAEILNSGRIPAQITEVIGKYFVGANISAAPDYTNPITGAEAIVRPGSHITQPFRSTTPLTEEQRQKIITREFCIFIWGFVKYTDAFGGDHIAGFGLKSVWQPQNNWIFEVQGGSAYNYVT